MGLPAKYVAYLLREFFSLPNYARGRRGSGTRRAEGMTRLGYVRAVLIKKAVEFGFIDADLDGGWHSDGAWRWDFWNVHRERRHQLLTGTPHRLHALTQSKMLAEAASR